MSAKRIKRRHKLKQKKATDTLYMGRYVYGHKMIFEGVHAKMNGPFFINFNLREASRVNPYSNWANLPAVLVKMIDSFIGPWADTFHNAIRPSLIFIPLQGNMPCHISRYDRNPDHVVFMDAADGKTGYIHYDRVNAVHFTFPKSWRRILCGNK